MHDDLLVLGFEDSCGDLQELSGCAGCGLLDGGTERAVVLFKCGELSEHQSGFID